MKKIITTLVLGLGLFSVVHAQTNGGKYQSSNFQYLTAALTSSSGTSQVSSAWNSSLGLPKYYALAVTTTASGFNVFLEGSLDNSNWQTLAITSSALGTTFVSSAEPSLYLRLRAATISAGTTVTGTAVGSW